MTSPHYIVKNFGQEQEPVVVIDGFSTDLELLRSDAARKSYQKLGPFYPGIRAQANPAYLGERMALLTEVLRDIFDFEKGAKLTECAYSLVTVPPEDLMPIQRLPHYDGLDKRRLAVLHYLGGPEGSGTAFYRHNFTGFETVTEDRFASYKERLNKEIEDDGLPPQQYIEGDTQQFTQIGKIDAKPNRLVIYRGITLHSGYIPKNMTLSEDPREGRLTINTFLSAK